MIDNQARREAFRQARQNGGQVDPAALAAANTLDKTMASVLSPQQQGQYHYHDNPVCLRYQLGDNLTKAGSNDLTPGYTETTGTHTHSPLLGFTYDGYPVYGPYGYATAMNSGSGVSPARNFSASLSKSSNSRVMIGMMWPGMLS